MYIKGRGDVWLMDTYFTHGRSQEPCKDIGFRGSYLSNRPYLSPGQKNQLKVACKMERKHSFSVTAFDVYNVSFFIQRLEMSE